MRDKYVPVLYEVIDVEMGNMYTATTKESRDAFINAVELVGHRYIVKEIRSRDL